MRVLIVEDTRDVGEAVVTSLGRAGFACDLALTLDEAEEALAVQACDAIVLDITCRPATGATCSSNCAGMTTGTPFSC